MYGLVNKAIEGMICSQFGVETWETIKQAAAVPVEVFISMEAYPDDLTHRLIKAASQTLGLSAAEIMQAFGEYWVQYTAQEGYGEMLEMAGDTLPEFLQNLDNLHAHVGVVFPQLQPPSFECTELESTSLNLHYRSARYGLAEMVIGLVKGLGKRFETPVDVTQLRSRQAGAEHDEFLVRYRSTPIDHDSVSLSLPPELFAQAFPFHLVLNRDLAILQVGDVLKRLLPQPLIGSSVAQHFRIHRPNIPIDFGFIVEQTRSLFLLESLHHPMQLKGQMMYAEDQELLFFLGSPWITDTANLSPLGLKLRDFAIHDPIVDFLFLLRAQTTALADMEKLARELSQQKAQLYVEMAERQEAERQARLYQASQLQIKELEEINRLKDDFLSTVSHELRTPISNMKLAIHMLKLATTEAQKSRYLEILQAECTREAALIDDLLDLQRLESGTKALELTTIHFKTWLSTILEPFYERTQACQQTLHVNFVGDIPDFQLDSACLERILAELLNNACKYTPSGEAITVTVEVHSWSNDRPQAETATDEVGAFILLSVCNSGVEIPANEFPHIFKKFYRIPGSDPWKRGGTGLGLALVQKLVKHLGGSIHAESSTNQTCFTVKLVIEALDKA